MSNEKLKPCPYCGKTTEDPEDGTYAVSLITYPHLHDARDTDYFVECAFCGRRAF